MTLGSPLRQWWLGCGWTVLALVAIDVRARDLGLDRNISDRLKFHAIPVAVSVLYHGRPHDYTAYQTIARHFQTTDVTTEALIASAIAAPVPAGDATYYWAADDRGMADFVIGAFRLFGPHPESLYRFYLLLLALSCALVVISAWREPAMMAILLFALASLYACVGIMPLAYPAGPGEQPSLFEPRMLELLAFIPAIHLWLAGWRLSRWTAMAAAALVGQVLIFVFCYQARSSILWEAAFVVITGVAAVWRKRWRSAIPVAALLVGLLLLKGYERLQYNPRYFGDMGTRTVWHNALMGLAANSRLAEKYHLSILDAAAIEAVIRDMRERRDPRLSDNWTTERITSSLGGWVEFDWAAYESAARTLYFRIWRYDYPEMLRCYLFDKPLVMLRTIADTIWRGGVRRSRTLSFNPLGVVPLLIIVPGLVFFVRRDETAHLIGGMVWLAAASLAPGLMFYAVVFTMIGTFASLAMLLYVAAGALLRRSFGGGPAASTA